MKINTEKGRSIGIYIAIVLLVLLIIGGAVTGGIVVGSKIVEREKAVEQPMLAETEPLAEPVEEPQEQGVSALEPQISTVAEVNPAPAQPKPDPADNRKIVTASEEYLRKILTDIQIPVKTNVANFSPNKWDIKIINDIDGELLHTAEITVQPRADGNTIFQISTGGDKTIDAVWYSAKIQPGVDALSRRYTPQGHALETTEELNQRIVNAALQPGKYGLKISYSANQNGPWISHTDMFMANRKSNWFILPPDMRSKHTTIFVKIEPIGWSDKTEFSNLSLNIGELNRRDYKFSDES